MNGKNLAVFLGVMAILLVIVIAMFYVILKQSPQTSIINFFNNSFQKNSGSTDFDKEYNDAKRQIEEGRRQLEEERSKFLQQ